jgi:hypothetical protein
MAETKWTPGAWVAYYDDRADEWSVRINTHGHWGIYTEIADLGGPDPEPQIEANAHLIAAAPDMAMYIKRKADEGDAEARALWNKANGTA